MTGLVTCVSFLLHLQRGLCNNGEDKLILEYSDDVRVPGDGQKTQVFYNSPADSEQVFRKKISEFDPGNTRGLSNSGIMHGSDFSFIKKLVSLERLTMKVSGRGSALAFLDGLSQAQGLRELNPSFSDISDSLDLEFVAKLPSLEKLDLSVCELTSASLKTLSEIETHESLKELDLSRNDFSDLSDLGFVAKLPSLEKLGLSLCRLTSTSLKTLSEIETHGSLKELDLSLNGFSDLSDLGFIAKLPSLEKLGLSICELTSAFLKTLSEIKTHESLNELNLSRNGFSDLSDFGFIAKLPSLEKLNLSYCELTPELKNRISELMKGRDVCIL